MNKNSLTLINPKNGELNFKIDMLDDGRAFENLLSYDFYTVIWVRAGSGSYRSYISEYHFEPASMLFFTPDQPFMITPDCPSLFVTLQWHTDFFCLEKNHKEVACNGVLFNNIYLSPSISVPLSEETAFNQLVINMQSEVMKPALAQWESLIAYLKIFLIHASRLKVDQSPLITPPALSEQNTLSFKLKEMIEQCYREKHLPRDYAEMLSITTKALVRLTKNHFNKTPTELIQERIIMEAKREIYLTDKTIKEIAYVLGFKDEYYFSRLFKKAMSMSPQTYRNKMNKAKAQQSTFNPTVLHSLTRMVSDN